MERLVFMLTISDHSVFHQLQTCNCAAKCRFHLHLGWSKLSAEMLSTFCKETYSYSPSFTPVCQCHHLAHDWTHGWRLATMAHKGISKLVAPCILFTTIHQKWVAKSDTHRADKRMRVAADSDKSREIDLEPPKNRRQVNVPGKEHQLASPLQ